VAISVAKAGAWSWHFDNHQVLWTPEFEILFDYEPRSTQQVYSEWIVDPWSAFGNRVHPDDSLSGRLRQRERVETQLQQTILQGRSCADARQLPEFRCDYRIVWRDGQIRWIAAIGELHSQPQGNLYMSGLVYDLSDRIEDRDRPKFQLLRQRVKRLDTLVDRLLNHSRLER
jgi:PAS fold